MSKIFNLNFLLIFTLVFLVPGTYLFYTYPNETKNFLGQAFIKSEVTVLDSNSPILGKSNSSKNQYIEKLEVLENKQTKFEETITKFIDQQEKNQETSNLLIKELIQAVKQQSTNSKEAARLHSEAILKIALAIQMQTEASKSTSEQNIQMLEKIAQMHKESIDKMTEAINLQGTLTREASKELVKSLENIAKINAKALEQMATIESQARINSTKLTTAEMKRIRQEIKGELEKITTELASIAASAQAISTGKK